MDEQESGRQIALEMQVACRNLGADANPVCGLFAIDQTTGQLDFLGHTEVMRSSPHPKFGKLLSCNFFPGRNQKLQLNIYSAPWKSVNGEVDSSIHEEDRLGSVIIAMDKAVPVSALDSKGFAPVSLELPLWHDTEPELNDKLSAQGANMKISFKAAEHQPEQYFGASGPKADQNIHQSLAMMQAGGEFLKYPWGSSGAPQKRFVWYDKNDGPMGTVYWGTESGVKKKKEKRSIPVHTITGLYEQNQTDAFRKHRKTLAKADRSNRCFSIVGRDRTLDLEAKSKEIVDAFMTGIHRVLSGSGFGVKEVSNLDKDELLSQPLIQNKFIIRARLRNLPVMPWASDDANDTLIAMSEKLPGSQAFKALEQTEWSKGNSNPNFDKSLLLPFTIPPSSHPIKFNVYDHQSNDKHLMGTSVVRLDFFYRYVGQEMMVKLRNASDPKIDAILTAANAYMLLKAEAEHAIPGWGTGAGGYNSIGNVVDEFRNRGDGSGSGGGGGGGGGGGSAKRPFFTRSTLAFMAAGCGVTCWNGTPAGWAGPSTLHFRSVEPFGQMVLCNEKSGDVDGLDRAGNPRDPLLTIPMESITECRLGVSPGSFAADKKKQAKPECCFTLVWSVPSVDSSAGSTASLDMEARDAGTCTAWATAIQEYISSVLEGKEGDDDDLFSFIKGGPKRGGGGIAGGGLFGGKKLGEGVAADDEAAVGDSLEKQFKSDERSKLGKALASAGKKKSRFASGGDSDDEDVDGIDLFGKDPVKKKKERGANASGAPDAPPIMGDGAPDAPPIMAPDMVFGAGAPPPPPGPPGAPGAPGMGLPKYNGPKMKHFHWEVLAPSDSGAENTLWSLISDDLEDEASKMLEELFKAADLKDKKKSAVEDEKKGVRLLDAKRANNIEIVLKSFRMPNAAIRDAILTVDTTILTVDKITALLGMVPSPDEKKALKAYLKSGKPVDKLGVAEQFALHMLEVSRVDTRLRLLLFQAKYDHLVEDMTSQYIRLIEAGETVKDSKQLMKVMETILSVGNKLNAGTRTGGATGFRLAALDKLNDTKSTDNKATLLDFIVEYVDRHKKTEEEAFEEPDSKAVEAGVGLPSYLDSITAVKDAAQIDWSALNSERETLMHGLQELSKEVELLGQEEVAEEDRFPEVMAAFLEHALKKAKKMKKRFMEAEELIDSLFEYFGESEGSFEPTDFFKLFDRFVMNYKGSELKMWQKRMKAQRDKVREANAAAKKAAGGSSASSSSGGGGEPDQGGGVGGLAAMMAARRASIEGNTGAKAAAAGAKSPDDDEWEEEKQPSKAEAKEEPKAAAEPAADATVAASAQ